jgi:hypothetical protein
MSFWISDGSGHGRSRTCIELAISGFCRKRALFLAESLENSCLLLHGVRSHRARSWRTHTSVWPPLDPRYLAYLLCTSLAVSLGPFPGGPAALPPPPEPCPPPECGLRPLALEGGDRERLR